MIADGPHQLFPSVVPVSYLDVLLIAGAQYALYGTMGLLVHLVYHQLPPYLVFEAYLFFNVFGLLTHCLGHRKWSGWWYTAHTMGHHCSDYPSRRFLSAGYVLAKHNNSPYYYPAIVGTALMVNLVHRSWRIAFTACGFLTAVFVAAAADDLHQAFHRRNHWLNRFAWFRKLRTLHYYHHRGDMKHNYALGDFLVEALLGMKLSWPHDAGRDDSDTLSTSS